MTERDKARLEGWSATLLVGEVRCAAHDYGVIKKEEGRNAPTTLAAKEELDFAVDLLRKKIAKLEAEAEIGRKVKELFKEVLK